MRRPAPPVSEEGYNDLRHETSSFLAGCYRESSLRAMISVEARAAQFYANLSPHDPNLDPEMAFLMWLRSLMQQSRISPASARQYLTYHAMAKISSGEAFRRATLQIPREERRQPETVNPNRVFNVVFRKPVSLPAVALALQWSTGCRWSDMERLRCRDVSFLDSGYIMVVFVGGKTDLSQKGQALLLPPTGRYIGLLRHWITHRQQVSPQGTLFQGLQYAHYNTYLRDSLCILSHGIRRSALQVTAEAAGQRAAQHLARHRNAASTEQYLPPQLWQATLETKEATRILQSQ